MAERPVPNDCPDLPGFAARLSTLILHEACQTVGGIGALAALLEVPQILVDRWLGGEDEVPEAIYQACIDIVLLHEPDEPALSVRRAGDSPR